MIKTKIKNCEELLKEIKTASEKTNDIASFGVQIMACYRSNDGISIMQLPEIDTVMHLVDNSELMALIRQFVKNTHPEMVIMIAPVLKYTKEELIPVDAIMMFAETPTKTQVFMRNTTNGVLDDKWEDMLPDENTKMFSLLGSFFTEPPENVDKIKDEINESFKSLDAPKTDVSVPMSSEKID